MFESRGGNIAHNVKRLCDGGFYAQRIFKTAIAKPVLTAVFNFFTNILKIIVFLFGSIKISRIFVKEITTKTKEIMTTITETKGFKIEFNGSKTYFVTDEHGQVWARTETLKTATNKLNKILTQSGLN